MLGTPSPPTNASYAGIVPTCDGSATSPAVADRAMRSGGVRRLSLAVVLSAAVAGTGLIASSADAAPKPVKKGAWKLVFNEEFNGKAVKSKYWNVRHRVYLPYDEAIITGRRDNVWTAQGLLVMQAKRQGARVGRSGHREYTTAYLDTIGKRSWKYGRFEVRAKLPQAVGTWPAFWLRANRGLGEVDILEGVGGLPTMAHQAVLESTHGNRGKLGKDTKLRRGTTAGWHVYGAIVAPDMVTWTIDGRPVFRVRTKDAPWLRETLNESFNIRLNLQVGGRFPQMYRRPLSAQSKFPSRYIVDWVRVYQRQG